MVESCEGVELKTGDIVEIIDDTETDKMTRTINGEKKSHRYDRYCCRNTSINCVCGRV